MQTGINQENTQAVADALDALGLAQYFEALKGHRSAVQLQHVMRLKEAARQGQARLEQALEASGVADAAHRAQLAAMLLDLLRERGGLTLKPPPQATLERDAQAWRDQLEADDEARASAHAPVEEDLDAPEPDPDHIGEAGEVWPARMKIVNGHLAHSIRAQGMLKEPNDLGYIHLAAEVERPHPLRRTSKEKKALLEALKDAAAQLVAAQPLDVQRADVFSAFIIPPGSREGRRVLAQGQHDVHIAEFDVVVLVECPSVEAAQRVRQTHAFATLKALLDDAARFVHCITAKNPKRIDEVDKTRDGVFLFNYFYAADVAKDHPDGLDVLLAVWEYTAGWWTQNANLDNSTPLQAIDGEPTQYTLINHCRWDRKIDIFPHLIFRPSMSTFVLKNFTANNIMAMPILYHLA